MKNKIWKIRGKEEAFTDEELIAMIQNGQLKKEDAITTQEMKEWIRISDSIYQFYINEGEKI